MQVERLSHNDRGREDRHSRGDPWLRVTISTTAPLAEDLCRSLQHTNDGSDGTTIHRVLTRSTSRRVQSAKRIQRVVENHRKKPAQVRWLYIAGGLDDVAGNLTPGCLQNWVRLVLQVTS